MQAYDTLHDSPTAQTGDDVNDHSKCITHGHTTAGKELNVTTRINTRQSDKITRKCCILQEYTAAHRL